ncbi:hypothetical protein IBT49_25755 [Erwinia sp. S63]|uniref:hypothetical protein n=1 Tax=Erwiniaceae TaxID=1903409 RepID=UPI00190A9C7B|nr:MULTISPECIES: hypothetical protein [Erwiniaceae]MBK0003884.1 hypothetical protein [Erwinia sp. S38]MBK0094264.1 hypothetical protein [Erwinia sp. S59]MBK0099407.1 hypothetical protein [Erwinia sp. S63]MBK0127581.1 hypothetical protein [Pantoea sp. S61]
MRAHPVKIENGAQRASFFRRHPVLFRVLCTAGALLVFLLAGLIVADQAVRNPAQAAAFRDWMEHARYGWLMWRLAVYGALAWGFVKVFRAPGFGPQHRQPLIRIAAVSVIFAVVCELVLLGGTGAS